MNIFNHPEEGLRGHHSFYRVKIKKWEKMNYPKKIKKAFNIYRQKPFIIWCLGRELNK
jgi:hypothetical protein